MTKSVKIFQSFKHLINSNEFKQRHSISERAFVRNCPLSFTIILFLILNQVKSSTAAEIFKFCNYFSKKIFSKSAFCKARKKLSYSAFVELIDEFVKCFYDDRKIKKLYGMTIFAIDGFKCQLPDSQNIIGHFGTLTNQSNIKTPAAQCSLIYDVLNEVCISSAIEPCDTSERDLAMTLINNFIKIYRKKDEKYLFIFDRGYPSILFLLFLITNNVDFLMRTNVSFLGPISVAAKSGEKDQIIEISLKKTHPKDIGEILKYFPDFKKITIKLRVLLVKLSTGETEILLTSLVDKTKYKYIIFKRLYFLRWGVEEEIKVLKIRGDIENISGKNEISVKQDFFSTILSINITKILASEAKEEFSEEPSIAQRKYEYDVNNNVAVGLIKYTLTSVLMDPESDLNEYSRFIKQCMKMNLEPIRPERSYKRRCKHPHRRFHMNQRRAT